MSPSKQKFGRRHAIGMRRNPALADIDFPIRKELAQMVVGPAVAEAKLEHLAVQPARPDRRPSRGRRAAPRAGG